MDLTKYRNKRTLMLNPLTDLKPVKGGFVNLTNIEVESNMEALLSYGPGFKLPFQPSITDTVHTINDIHKKMEKDYGPTEVEFFFKGLYRNYEISFDEYMDQIDEENTSHTNHTLRKAIKCTAEFFKTNEDLMIIQADKGKKTAIINVEEYKKKMNIHMEKNINRGIYEEMKNYDKIKRTIEASYNNIKEKLLKAYNQATDKPFPKEFKIALETSKEFQPPTLYGTIKCHKEGTPIRPICASMNWYSYNIQKIINDTLNRQLKEQLCPNNIINLNDVIPEIYNIPIMEGYVFAKYDIQDMYTNMNRKEIMNLLMDIIHDKDFKSNCRINPQLLQHMIKFSLETGNIVRYDQVIYKQKKGLPQGACDSGLYATIYLDFLLQNFKEMLFQQNRIVFWYKYMDDFLVYLPKGNINKFKKDFENITKLKLDVEEETEKDGQQFISFLNLGIYRGKRKIEMASYKKPTDSMRTINYLSNQPKHVKLNTIKQFLNNIINRTSNSRLNQDLDELENKLKENSYPYLIIRKCYIQMLDEHIQKLKTGQPLIPMTTNEKQDRINIMQGYKRKFGVRKVRILTSTNKNDKNKNRITRTIYNTHCAPFSRLIMDIHKKYKLPTPIFKTKSINYKTWNTNTPQSIGTVKTKEETNMTIGITKCRQCDEYYIIYGKKNVEKLLEENVKNKHSDIRKHMEEEKHEAPTNIYKIYNTDGKMDLATQVQIYNALFKTKGISCHASKALANIPKYIRRIIEKIITKKETKRGKEMTTIEQIIETLNTEDKK